MKKNKGLYLILVYAFVIIGCILMLTNTENKDLSMYDKYIPISSKFIEKTEDGKDKYEYEVGNQKYYWFKKVDQNEQFENIITIKYNPDDPTQIYIKTERTFNMMPIYGALLISLGLLIFAFMKSKEKK